VEDTDSRVRVIPTVVADLRGLWRVIRIVPSGAGGQLSGAPFFPRVLVFRRWRVASASRRKTAGASRATGSPL
ncbi:MAG: hypothetical protein ACRDYC_13280, partial [Acidimicrobiales bacterium]